METSGVDDTERGERNHPHFSPCAEASEMSSPTVSTFDWLLERLVPICKGQRSEMVREGVIHFVESAQRVLPSMD